MGKPPFYVHDMANNRDALVGLADPQGAMQMKVNDLYAQVGQFWPSGPNFKDPKVVLVASYGIAASAINAEGGNWRLVNFKEGNTVWLDTINFHKDLTGRKLEAAEIFANYFIGKTVQDRVVNELGMVAASTLVTKNPLIDANPKFFAADMFWPPYGRASDNLMLQISKRAMKQ